MTSACTCGTGAAVALTLAAMACGDSPGTECACADPGVVVDIPGDLASAAMGVQLSGVACASATAVCVRPAGSGCSEIAFRAVAAGTCTIDVQFATGIPDFEATRHFVRLPCCAGYYADPPQGATIAVPSAAGDGGGGP
jgi:hypothetical protein